ncbi:Fe-S-cluster-containing hydrogenase component 2 [Youngiibacter multivorans]|uniref:Fe-S-cluster-containing hydrogenase component 2 n=1 Tax=Youngiibacter multivorans TaxID=937251 RepID=A0ABS4G777_9CLOT|nr:Fe-S-cluster-containing hydrogenase component 2 [Youngiibacter multivorans]
MFYDGCIGCHVCETVCSYHHLGRFEPSSSSIEIKKGSEGNYPMIFFNGKDGKRVSCDLCRGLEEPLCVKYCSKFKFKKHLSDIVTAEKNNRL